MISLQILSTGVLDVSLTNGLGLTIRSGIGEHDIFCKKYNDPYEMSWIFNIIQVELTSDPFLVWVSCDHTTTPPPLIPDYFAHFGTTQASRTHQLLKPNNIRISTTRWNRRFGTPFKNWVGRVAGPRFGKNPPLKKALLDVRISFQSLFDCCRFRPKSIQTNPGDLPLRSSSDAKH